MSKKFTYIHIKTKQKLELEETDKRIKMIGTSSSWKLQGNEKPKEAKKEEAKKEEAKK